MYLTLKPVEISTKNIMGTSTGFGHAGKFSLKPVFKIHWKKGDQYLVSGFSSKTITNDLEFWKKMFKKVSKRS
jgi:hypothetical protein